MATPMLVAVTLIAVLRLQPTHKPTMNLVWVCAIQVPACH